MRTGRGCGRRSTRQPGPTSGHAPTTPANCSTTSSPSPGWHQVTVSWRSAAPPARPPSPWPAGASRSPASSSAQTWLRSPAGTSTGPAWKLSRDVSRDWRPAAGQHFDLVFAATAWNWIDPARRYALAWRALRPGGHLAFWNALHVFPDGGDPFFREIQDVYDEIAKGCHPAAPGPARANWPTRRLRSKLSCDNEYSCLSLNLAHL